MSIGEAPTKPIFSPFTSIILELFSVSSRCARPSSFTSFSSSSSINSFLKFAASTSPLKSSSELIKSSWVVSISWLPKAVAFIPAKSKNFIVALCTALFFSSPMSLSPAESFKSPFIPDKILIILFVCPWVSFTYPIDISKESCLGFLSSSDSFSTLLLLIGLLALNWIFGNLKMFGWMLKFIKLFLLFLNRWRFVKIKIAISSKKFTIIYMWYSFANLKLHGQAG